MDPNSHRDEATILRPNPSGRRSIASESKKSDIARDSDTSAQVMSNVVTLENAFTQRAVPLLNLVVALKTTAADTDGSRLKSDLLSEINAYRQDLTLLKLDDQAIENATFALSAYIDEMILSTPWAERARWAESSLLMALFQVSWGGEKVAKMLSAMTSGNSTQPELAGFFLILLELGYQGQFEIMKDGAVQREQVIQSLLTQVRAHASRSALEISANLNHPASSRLTWRDRLPLWVVISVVLFILLFVYVSLQTTLTYKADDLSLIPLQTATPSPGSEK
jgi:type VI secretion system protein ImpK